MDKENLRLYKGVNWNDPENDYAEAFWRQNTSSFWLPEEMSLTQDISVWQSLPQKIKDAYSKNLMTLTFFDTHQGVDGMVHLLMSMGADQEQTRGVLSFVSTMEVVHAKSYSTIFTTYLSPDETRELFLWGENQKNLQALMNYIIGNYKEMGRLNACKEYGFEEVDDFKFKVQQWKTMVTSVFLESWLFYSGFYYPLWFFGQGKLTGAGEIINLIIRDESVHGLFVGRMAKEIWETFDENTQKELSAWMYELLDKIYKEQSELIAEIYDEVDLTHDVKIFMRYNCNKALMNLGFDPYWPEEEVNPVVLNGLNTETKSQDMFSLKGNGYQKPAVEELKDEDFNFDFD